MDIQAKTLRGLEFDKIREKLAGFAKFPQSRKLCLNAPVYCDFEEIKSALRFTREAKYILDNAMEVPIEFIADIARPLPGYTFDAGKLGGETFAYPWCRGSYFLLTGEGDFSDVTPQNTGFSIGRGASVTVAAAVDGIVSDCA